MHLVLISKKNEIVIEILSSTTAIYFSIRIFNGYRVALIKVDSSSKIDA